MELRMVSKQLPGIHVKAMVKAMKAVPQFVIEKTPTTVVVNYKAKDGKKHEVFRAIKNSKIDLWLVRHEERLFK